MRIIHSSGSERKLIALIVMDSLMMVLSLAPLLITLACRLGVSRLGGSDYGLEFGCPFPKHEVLIFVVALQGLVTTVITGGLILRKRWVVLPHYILGFFQFFSFPIGTIYAVVVWSTLRDTEVRRLLRNT